MKGEKLDYAVIKIWPWGSGPGKQMDVQTNGVPVTNIMSMLKALQKHFATKLVEDAQKACGTTDDKVIEEYLQKQCDLESGDFDFKSMLGL